MRRSFLVLISSLGLGGAAYGWHAHVGAGRVGDLSVADAARARRLGAAPFTPAAWRTADRAVRARMVASLAAQYRFVGRHRDAVVALLGRGDCYADYEDVPCYALAEAGRPAYLIFTTAHSGSIETVLDVSLADTPM